LRNQSHIAKVKGYKSSFFVLILLLVILSFSLPQAGEGVVAKISDALNMGDVQGLGKHFNNTIDLSLPGSEGTYSNKQTEQLLKAFYKTNSVKSFKLDHQGNSNDGSQYMIGTLVSNTGKTFRVYVLIKKFGDNDLIQQLQFEEE
jgi:hypothetical protein